MTISARRPRADALRNRERLIEAAKTVFADHGAEGSLEEIARRAEVGIGTLYRHFPTRDAMIEAVYSREVERLADAADALIAAHAPLEALRQWLIVCIDYMATKRVIVPVLNTTPGAAAAYETSGAVMRAAVGKLLDNAKAARAIRADIDTADLFQALAGVAYDMTAEGWRARALKLVDIVVAGLRA